MVCVIMSNVVRSLCFLSILVVCTVVSQVALLPFYNSEVTVSLLCLLSCHDLAKWLSYYLYFFFLLHRKECRKSVMLYGHIHMIRMSHGHVT